VIERKYKNDIIKLFGKLDSDNSDSIDFIEFKKYFLSNRIRKRYRNNF